MTRVYRLDVTYPPDGGGSGEDYCKVHDLTAGDDFLPECGRPSVIVISYRCPEGCECDTPMCAHHRDLHQPDESGDDPRPMVCLDCTEEPPGWPMDITSVRSPVRGPMLGQGLLDGA